MRKTMVRYKLKPGQAAANEAHIQAVFAQLEQERPAGLRYSCFKLADGVSFVHVAVQESEGPSLLQGLPAFKAYTASLPERCEELPVFAQYTEIASYGAQKT